MKFKSGDILLPKIEHAWILKGAILITHAKESISDQIFQGISSYSYTITTLENDTAYVSNTLFIEKFYNSIGHVTDKLLLVLFI